MLRELMNCSFQINSHPYHNHKIIIYFCVVLFKYDNVFLLYFQDIITIHIDKEDCIGLFLTIEDSYSFLQYFNMIVKHEIQSVII